MTYEERQRKNKRYDTYTVSNKKYGVCELQLKRCC